MLLTRASEYALLTLDYLRRHTKPIGAEQLAMDLNIPKSFLAKILQNLAKQGILESHKGAYGGFTIARTADKIFLSEIILASEGKKPLVFDCTQYSETCPYGMIGSCNISPFLANFQNKVDTFLENLTLEDILN
ncbi:MAG: Rrf2 family transcriptional regulator [Sulfurovum sp.]|nr:MAG: Rrf2 family transcriptional regulator [Sulfurovum sp.]